jgi:hypothetical protein
LSLIWIRLYLSGRTWRESALSARNSSVHQSIGAFLMKDKIGEECCF